MTIPAQLLQAIATPGGGRVALVIGAGCSVEEPTGIPVAQTCSNEVHRMLVANGILENGECPTPGDLSVLADTVFKKHHSQSAVVSGLLDRYNLRLASANDGYRTAAALLVEGAVVAVLTLNFDLGMTAALSDIGAPSAVSVIDSPGHLGQQRQRNVYYLHRNANELDAEKWVLRTETLLADWKGGWEEVIAQKVLATPNVVFAGLGTPVAVLLQSVRYLKAATPGATQVYQVDPGAHSDSVIAQELAIPPAQYVPMFWGAFADLLGKRLVAEHLSKVVAAGLEQVVADGQGGDVPTVGSLLTGVSLLRLGALRAKWIGHGKRYCPHSDENARFLGYLFAGLAAITELGAVSARLGDDDAIDLVRDGKVVTIVTLVSGSGVKGKTAVEARLLDEHKRARLTGRAAGVALIGGVLPAASVAVAPPTDLIGESPQNDIVDGPALRIVDVAQVRAPDAISLVQEILQ